jgi:hypothetical protein
MKGRQRARLWTLGSMMAVLLLSAALAWHDLGVREVLGRDENLTIAHSDMASLADVLAAASMNATGQPGNMQPLYFLLQNLYWPLVGRSAFVLRFLASTFDVLAVAFAFKLGEVLFAPWPGVGSEGDGEQAGDGSLRTARLEPGAPTAVGLIGALLTALLPLDVQYAQIARPYTMLAMLSLATAYFLILALKTNRPRAWAGFVLATALNFYGHYNALFVLAVEGLFAGAVWLATLAAVRRKQQSAARLAGPAFGFLAVGVICLPGLIRFVQLPWVGSGGEVQVELTVSFFYRFLYKIGLTTPWLRGAILGLMGLGLLAVVVRRRWQAALFTVLWLALPLGVLSVLKSPRPFVERYVIFLPPMALLLAGEGLVRTGQALGDLGQRWGGRRMRQGMPAVLAIGLALLFVAPLRETYAANRQAARMDLTLEVVERHAQPGDLIMASPRFLVRPLAANGAEVLYLTRHLSLSSFEELLARHHRTWILYTSYLPPAELQEPLDQWIQARPDEFVRVPIKAITALAYYNESLADPEARLQDRIILLQELAEVSADKQEAWLRYDALAGAYESLSALYASRGERSLAADYQLRAEEARATAPRPW